MKKLDKVAIKYLSIAIVTTILLITGVAYAYFQVNISNDASTDVNVSLSKQAELIFNADDDLVIDAGLSNFYEDSGNLSSTVNATATLIADSGAEGFYYVYFYISENDFVYTTGDETAELILTVYNEDDEIISESDELDYVEVGDVKGFDITTQTGVFSIEELVKITKYDEEDLTHTWTFTLTFINLDGDQNANAGKTFDSTILIIGEEADECDYNMNLLRCAILSYEGGADYIESKGEPVWGTSSSIDEGIYAIDDEYGTSYYFRGAVDDNWIIFGTDENGDDMYWRITRINGDGSVRMVYSGTTAPTEETSVVMIGTSTLAGTSQFNSSNNQAEYVGYMYTLGEAHGTSESSTIKTALETWYKNNLLDETDQIADSYYCYDRTTAISGYQNSSFGYSNSTYSTYQTGVDGTLFAAVGRNTATSSTYGTATTSPSLMCDNINDQYTASDTTYGNGELEYSIGLLTFDEAVLAGYAAGSSTATTLNYLYRGSYHIWLGSPFGFSYNSSYANVSRLNPSGYVANDDANTSRYLLLAVSLSSLLIVEGDGTYESPYKIVES